MAPAFHMPAVVLSGEPAGNIHSGTGMLNGVVNRHSQCDSGKALCPWSFRFLLLREYPESGMFHRDVNTVQDVVALSRWVRLVVDVHRRGGQRGR